MGVIRIGSFLARLFLVSFIIVIEVLAFFYLKDASGELTNTGGMTMAEYMRVNGGMQFSLAAYMQKIVFIILLSYPVLITVLWAKESREIARYITGNSFHFSVYIFLLNFISFGALVLFFLYVTNPVELISQPRSFKALFYTCIPFFWGVYLFSILELLFPVSILWKAIKNNIIFTVAIFLLISISTNPVVNPIHFSGVLEFWSKLLLEPTLNLAESLAKITGFDAHIFSFPGAAYPDFGTTRFHAGITPDCSGYEGITLVAILLAGYCYMNRSSLHLARSLLILPAALIAIFFLNAIRIVVLIAIGHFFSPDLAFNGFHTVGGWINLLVVLISSLWVLNRLTFFIRETEIQSTAIEKNPIREAYLSPLVALITCSLVTKIFTVDFFWLYPVPIVVASWIIYYYRKILRLILVYPSALSFLVGGLVFLIWIYIIPNDEIQNLHFFEQLQSAPIGVALMWLICRVMGAAIIVPIAEELAFRGFLLPFLGNLIEECFSRTVILNLFFSKIKYLPPALALIGTSIIFGIMHSYFLPGCIAGLLYGLIYCYKRKLIDAIVAHSITNSLLAIYVIYFGNWSYW